MSGVAYMCCDGLRMIKWSSVDLQGSGCSGGHGCLSGRNKSHVMLFVGVYMSEEVFLRIDCAWMMSVIEIARWISAIKAFNMSIDIKAKRHGD